jgi:AAA ATPase domain
MLFGRDAEIRQLAELIGNASATGQALVMVGEPGIGKTALLGAAGDLARGGGLQVLTATGVESETQFPFAGLHQLLRPVLGVTERIAAAHRRALLAAFGLADGPSPEFYLIALAAVAVVAAVAAERPAAVLVDDVQWLDPQTQEVLTFLARRVSRHRLAIVGAARTGYSSSYLAAGLARLEVLGVDEKAADEILLVRVSIENPAERTRIRRQARGNPLALLELPGAWAASPRGLAGDDQPALTARLERAFAGRLAELPAPTRDAVLVAAVDPVNALTEILAAAARLHRAALAGDVLDPAAEAGLVSVGDGQLWFRHPLVRSGVLQAETLARRQAAHAALAAVLDGEPYRRTWHRAQSIVGPDDEVADELEANVAVALRRGAVMSAIADLQRSAQLTRSSARRGRRLLRAAEHAFGLGRTDLVDELVKQASLTELTELDWARTQWLREIFSDGIPGDATRVLELCGIARHARRAGDRDLALNLLLGAALRCWWADTGPAARTAVTTTLGELGDWDGDPRYVAALAVADPVPQCGAVLDLLARFAAADVADGDALRLLGMAAHAIGDTVRSVDFLSRAEAVLREQGRLGLLSQVLSMQVVDRLELGDWSRAAAAAEEGERLAQETGQPIWRAGTLVCDAMSSAFRGDVRQAFAHAAEVEFLSSRQRLNDLLSCVQLARGAALVTTGQYAAAYPELRRLFEPSDPSFHQRERFGGIMFLADAAAEAGERDDARDVISGLEAVAAVAPSPVLGVHLRYARAVLADPPDAPAAYAELMAADYARWPWARARAELAYGSWLWRERAGAEALGPLRRAEAGFSRIGAASWAARARRERARALARNK